MRRLPCVLAAGACISGCVVLPTATVPTPDERARPAQAERLLAFQDRREDSTATVVVTRDLGAFGGACYYAVAIDGRLAARLDMGERSSFYLVPGDILLAVGGDPQARGLCAVGQGKWSEQKVLLRAHETAHFRLSIEASGQVVLQRAGNLR